MNPAEMSALSGGARGDVAQSKELPPPTGKIDDASFIENSKIETDKGGKSGADGAGQPGAAERKMLEDSESEEETPLELLTMEAEDIHAPTKYLAACV